MTLHISSRLMATAALGALMLAAVPAVAQEKPVTTPATTAAKPEIGDFGFDLSGMDKSVQPGDDFYTYANGTWAKNTNIPDDKSNYGMFTALNDLSQTRTREILDAAKGDPSSMIGRAYASYLDSATVEAKGLAPIQPWLNKIRAVEKPGLAALLAEADRSGVQHFFGGYVGQDDKNPDVYAYIIFQGGIGMPDRDFYLKENERNTSLQAAYLKHLENVLTLAGETNAAARAKAVYDFEKQVATIHWDKNDSSDATKAYNKMTIAELAKAAPGFDWSTFIRGIGVKEDTLIVSQPSAFTGEAKLLADAPIAVIRDLLIVRSLDSFSGALPDAVAKEAFSFYSTALSGTPQMEERWKRAVDFTTGNLGDAVGKDYVAKYFPPETKAAMDTLVKNVLGAMGRRIDGLTWMQPATKVKARKKLANFTTKIGYPDQWKDYSKLEIRADDLFGNALRSNQFAHDDNIGHLGGPIRRWEWFMTPMTINAYANFGMNEIVFPAAILQPPFFDPHADAAVNYGGIGAVIGHEVSHHFDDQGAKYDETGKLADWWTPEDVKAFEAAGQALIAQYNAYEILPGEHIDGKFTLGENIGDLAGLTVAYDAYKASLGGKEAPVIDGLTGDQRFFLGWAQVWRRNYREQNLSQRITTDPHSPSIQRTWVSRNLDPWYKAYQIKQGQKLYLAPKDRVRIW
ncbi:MULTISPECIES: M13 family metallopeptidase [unclassified Sphingopyxis]|jgi:putative endopeptidase|uniref:M13 family metallopeptidase n=1 Tax=unclassified Sphingopyxis TaxID=2614943 RepID=UPI0006C34228|nr:MULTISPECIES: M13 family metallopeptidase [unclassified Sphingopyxis]USI75585.1 M13 family metallopeptidase [Sphingopyxis sp. USTB-05]GAO77904.1 metallopeptidase [Sphingopyxis sp. C-1]